MVEILRALLAKCERLLSSAGVSSQSQTTHKPVTEMSTSAIETTTDSAPVRGGSTSSPAVRGHERADAGTGVHTTHQAKHSSAIRQAKGFRSGSSIHHAQQVIESAAAAGLLRNGKSTDSIMSNSLPPNPFQSVRPKGIAMPSAPVPRKTTNTSSNSAFGSIKTLDARGRQTVSLKPPPHFGLVGALCTADAGMS